MTKRLKLSPVERLILINQYRLLEKLDPSEAKGNAESLKILEGGYVELYGTLTANMSDEVDPILTIEVVDILAMFSVLRDSIHKLSDQSKVDEHRATFRGFDGNEEPIQYWYTEFLHECGRFSDLLRDANLNSHSNVLDGYREMLSRFQPFARQGLLSEEQIRTVIERPAVVPNLSEVEK